MIDRKMRDQVRASVSVATTGAIIICQVHLDQGDMLVLKAHLVPAVKRVSQDVTD